METNTLYTINKKHIVYFVIFLLVAISLLTQFSWSADKEDYSDVAKFFSGSYSAKLRTSHSYLFGFIHTPFVEATNSFIFFKISSLIFLLLIVYSVYRINGRDKKTMWLMLLSPIIWYMGPWTNPIQMASLIFLWAYYFIDLYNSKGKLKHLIYSGLLIGFGWAVWDPIFIFGFLLGIIFLFNKKFSHFAIFGIFVFIGLSPRFILDQVLFGFPFYTIMKKIAASIITFWGGIYPDQAQWTPKTFVNIILLFITIPIMFWNSYISKDLFEKTKTLFFLSLCLLVIFMTPQIRYVLFFVPIMILLIGKRINKKQFKRHIIFSIIVIVIFVFPYLVQLFDSGGAKLGGVEITYLAGNSYNFGFGGEFSEKLIDLDLDEIMSIYSNEVFVVGNKVDTYQILATTYWGKDVKEFVSIQDYELYLSGNDQIYGKDFTFVPKFNNRRQIWISGGMDKHMNDETDYGAIEYGIGLEERIELEDFVFFEKYNNLFLSQKVEIS